MKIILRLIILFCIFSSTVYGQTGKLILTHKQNTQWLDSLKTLPLDQQLITINKRLLADTNVYVKQSYGDRIRVADSSSLGNRVYGDARLILIIDGYPMIIDNKTKPSQIIRLTKLLTPQFIKTIGVLRPNDLQTMDGLAGSNGAIVMTTKKKYWRKFRRLKLKSNY